MNVVNDENIYILNSIQRYNTQHRIHNESVAAHSYFVTYFVNRICTEFELNDKIRLMALEAALMHDVPEVVTNDITHDAKELIDGISKAIKPYEELIVKEQSMRAYCVLFAPMNIEEQIAQAVVNHADIISVHMFCDNEVRMGNMFFQILLEGSMERLGKSLNALQALVSIYKAKNKTQEEVKDAKEQ
jgi:5'-deoxynucleotidase YfbR-like HD superfamily hydrolase